MIRNYKTGWSLLNVFSSLNIPAAYQLHENYAYIANYQTSSLLLFRLPHYQTANIVVE
jgi:hypothetical protein